MELNQKQKMAISGFVGFSFFLIANFTNTFKGLNLTAGVLQILINTFVFVVWLSAFKSSTGKLKFVAFFGMIVPVIMASVTLIRVIIPSVF